MFATGTELNAQPGYDAEWALGYVDIVTLISDHRIEISGLDFIALSDASLSFAVASTELFEAGERASVKYKIEDGPWLEFVALTPPDASWRIESVNFGNLLDGVSNVSIRIDYEAVFDVGSSLRFDNVTVSVVPEPGNYVWGIAAALAMAAYRRKMRA